MAFDPIPVPVRGSATFNADAEAFAQGMSQFATDYNALSSVIDGALTSTSTTSLTIGTGSKTLTVQTGLGYVIGYPLRISSVANPTNFMDGIVTAYNTLTGSLTVNVTAVGGSGTIASWNTMVLPGGGNFAGLSYNKFTARQVLANEVTLASASTIDFTAGDSNQFLITGSTTINAVTMEQGAVIKARFASSCQLTHGTNLQVEGTANFTTAAGDIATFTSNGTVVRVEISRLNGRSVVQTDIVNLSNDAGLTDESPDKAASPEWVKGLVGSGSFNNIQVFTTSGTFTVPAGVTKVKATVSGGGGGAGGSSSGSTGGGGAGGCAIKIVDTSSLGSSVSVTVGTGGVGGGAGLNGGAGQASSFGSVCSATGGSGSVAQGGTSSVLGGGGGIGTGGDLNVRGQTGGSASGSANGSGVGGVNPSGYGRGADGRASAGDGASGSGGVVIVEW